MIDYDELRDKLASVYDWISKNAEHRHEAKKATNYCAEWFNYELTEDKTDE